MLKWMILFCGLVISVGCVTNQNTPSQTVLHSAYEDIHPVSTATVPVVPVVPVALYGEPVALYGAAEDGATLLVGVMGGTVYNSGNPSLKDFGLEVGVFVEERFLDLIGVQLRGAYVTQDLQNPTAGFNSIVGIDLSLIGKLIIEPVDSLEVYAGVGVGIRIDQTDFGAVAQNIANDAVFSFLAGLQYNTGLLLVGVEAGYQNANPDWQVGAIATNIDLSTLMIRVSLGLRF